MAAGFRRGGKDMELEELKAYCRIDYDDDDEVIKLIYAAVHGHSQPGSKGSQYRIQEQD